MAMKRILFSLMMVMMGLCSMAQNRVPGCNVVFGFPDGGWKYLSTVDVDQNTKVYLYSYSAEVVTDAAGDTVLPNMRIYVRKNYTGSVFDLVLARYEHNPYQAVEEYTDGLPSADGVGYKAYYKNVEDNKDYLFNLIYFKDKTTIVEVRMETTMDTYEAFESKFMNVLKSFAIEK